MAKIVCAAIKFTSKADEDNIELLQNVLNC